MPQRLYRSNENKVIGGVCGGLGEYFDIDPNFIRVITVFLFLAYGTGLLAYLLAWIIIPRRPLDVVTPAPPKQGYRYSGWQKYLPGLALIALGTILLLQELWWWLDWEEVIPILLILVGIAIIANHGRRRREEKEISGREAHSVNGNNGGNGS